MAEFPATEYDQLVTRDHLRAEMALVRTEMHELRHELQGDMHELEGRLLAEITGIRADMQAGDANLRSEIHDLRVEMHASFARVYIVVAGAIGGSLVGGMGLAAAIG
jgi:hypothetical protein